MSAQSPIEFCPHRADLENNIQYGEMGEVQFFEPEDSADELNGKGACFIVSCGLAIEATRGHY